MPRIDTHAHVIPPRFLEALPKLPPLAGIAPVTIDEMSAFMDRFEIDAAVVSAGPPGVFFGDPGQARELARVLNEELIAISRSDPRRFGAVASLPVPDVEGSLAEVSWALDDAGFDGVMLFTNAGGVYLGDRSLDPLMAELDRRGAYVFVHPTMPANGIALPHHPFWLYEFPFDTTRAITNLIYSGTFERYPRIRWQFSHLGGTAPFIAHRLASLADREPEKATEAPAGALAYLSRQFYDTGLNNHEPAIETTLQLTAFDHIVFGSDWPYLATPSSGSDATPDLDYLGAERRAALEGEHARALVPRLFS